MTVAEEERRVVVYLRGDKRTCKWYRFELPIKKKEEDDFLSSASRKRRRTERRKIYPVAKMYEDFDGSSGSWDVVGDDIYWIGGSKSAGQGRMSIFKKFRKHNITDPDRSFWEDVSSDMNIPRRSPFVAAVGKKKNKLCVVGGDDYYSVDYAVPFSVDRWSKCGEIYDIDKKTWTSVDAEYEDISPYNATFSHTAIVEKDGEDPKQVVFYSLREGSVVYLDLISGKSFGPLSLANFALGRSGRLPEGLKDIGDISMLHFVILNVKAVFANDTFYWCTPDMRLYGYDVKLQRWLRSPSLKREFPSVRFQPDAPPNPILLGLGNGKFLVCVVVDSVHPNGLLTLAFLTVDKRRNYLSVSVDLVPPLYFDDPSFVPCDGKAIVEG